MKKKLIITFSIIAVLAVAGYFGYRFAVNYVFDEYVVKSALTVYEQKEKEKENTPESAQAENKKGIQIEAILDGLRGKNKDKYMEPEVVLKSSTEGSEEKATDKKSDSAKSEEKKNSGQGKNDKTNKSDTVKPSKKTETTDAGKKTGSAKTDSGKKTESGVKTETPKNPAQSSGKRLSDSEVLMRVMQDSSLAYKMASMVSYSDKQAVISMVMSNFTADEIAEMAASGMSKSEMISVARSSITGAQWSQCMEIARGYIDQMRPYVE